VSPPEDRATVVVEIPTSGISDWPSFHDVFATALGFADYYGHNNNAFSTSSALHEPRT
jgi:RNAse (barnase) inhibitor barstar